MTVKVMTIVGTRPEIIKLSRVINELDLHIKHILVHTGQNYDYELNDIFFRQLNIRKPDYFLDAGGKTPAQTIANVIAKSDEILEKEQPDAVLLLGDTNSSLAAITAKRRKIPIFHMEAGNRCFDQRVPEEINRKIVDHISDINLTYTEHARRYLLEEGISAEMVIKTGSPMKEVLSYYKSEIDESKILTDIKVEPKGFFIVSAHREENIDDSENFDDLINMLNAVADYYKKPVIVSTHPRTRKKIEEKNIRKQHEHIRFLKPLGFIDYVNLQKNAYCVISDSGTITEESSILDFPAVMIRQAHERPEGMDEGTVIMCGLKVRDVIDAIDIVSISSKPNQRRLKLVEDYDVDDVSRKVLHIIMSYISYINRVVWRK